MFRLPRTTNMPLAALITRIIPWGAAAEAGVKLARLGIDYKLERDRLKTHKREKDVAAMEKRLDAVEERFEHQLEVMQELATGLEREIGKMRRGIIACAIAAGLALVLGGLALVLALV